MLCSGAPPGNSASSPTFPDPLEYFDLVIDPRGRRLIGDPAHGGEHIFELLRAKRPILHAFDGADAEQV
jgi:hypothetical protein